MTNLADYEQWDYRKIFKIDPCNCEDEECNTFILSVRKTHAIAQYDDDQKWVKLAILDNDLLVDLIKNSFSDFYGKLTGNLFFVSISTL